MLSKLATRPALAATTSVAALVLGTLVVMPAMQRDMPATRTAEEVAEPAPLVVEKAATAAAKTATRPGAVDEADETPGDGRSARADGDAAVGGEIGRTGPARKPAPAERAMADAPSGDPVEREGTFAGVVAEALTEAPAAPTGQSGRLGAMDGSSVPAPTTSQFESGALRDRDASVAEPDTEAFANAERGAVKQVAIEPVSTFSIDVDTASYALVRSSLLAGYLPPPEAVRVEEMVNYFPYGYTGPEAGEPPFRPQVTVVPAPWNDGKRLVHIAVQGRLPAQEDRPALNLVFLIDTSGSMQDTNKLPLLKQSFRLMLGQLRPEDQVAIVTYAGSAGQVLEPTPAREAARIMAALDRLEAGGSTAGQQGLEQAYQVAEGMAGDGEVTRVILATDGDFNVGISDPEALTTFIEGKRRTGTYLSVLGFGRGNIDDAVMQALAQNGNGTAAYIDTLSEAQKVLVDQLSGALFPIANDVKIQMEFNPAVIAEYRLIGYETRALAREDFNNDRVDAGDIGAGHSVTAIYEVTPLGSPAVLNDPLRYATDDAAALPASDSAELGFLKLRYKEPGATISRLIEVPVSQEPGEAGESARFAIAMAGFGQLLTGAEYLGDWGWDQAIALANGAKGADAFGYRAEAVQIMRLAQSLSR